MAQFHDEFNSPHLTSWRGDTSDFIVEEGLLHLSSDSAGHTIISRSVRSIQDSFWQGEIQLDFLPSASNHLTMDLIHSDSVRLALTLGQTGPDSLFFIQEKNGIISSQATGIVFNTNPNFTFRLKKDGDSWLLKIACDTSVNLKIPSRIEVPESFDFRLNCLYTSTRSDKFHFDNIAAGYKYRDTTPPSVLLFSVLDSQSLHLQFNESTRLDSISVDPQLSIGQINMSADSTHVIIDLADKLEHDSTYNLKFLMSDTSGNRKNYHHEFSYLKVGLANFGQLVISEIMADPSPGICFPEIEYIELFNRSTHALNLGDYNLSDDRRTSFLPDTIIHPSDYVCLVAKRFVDTVSFPAIGVEDLVTVNNDADDLILWDFAGRMIHRVKFDRSWYREADRSQGGYSLEMIDVNQPCLGASNWKAASYSLCGTPGYKNSVDDEILAVASNLKVQYQHHPPALRLYSNQTVQWSQDSADYQLIPPIHFDNITEEKSEGFLEILLSDTLKLGHPYIMGATGIETCDNQTNQMLWDTFFRARPPGVGEVIINEVLFNPASGGSDFFELRNTSSEYISLKDVCLDTRSLEDSSLLCIHTEIELNPNNHIAFTKDTQFLNKNYDTGRIYPISWNGIPDEGGRLILQKRKSQTWIQLDEVVLHEDSHHPALPSDEGVSLERIGLSDQWLSASSQVGFATPGLPNSQNQPMDKKVKTVMELAYSSFSPNADGYRDVLPLHYNLGKNGFNGRIDIFDMAGNYICRIVEDELLSSEGSLHWDGRGKDNSRIAPGIYLIFGRFIHPDGDMLCQKCTCVVN